MTFDLIVSADFVVAFSLYLTFDVKIIDVVSGVTITGVTLATLYFFKLFTIFNLVASVNVEPDLGTTPI